MIKIKKIISGGQTGVDQAALQAGLDLGFRIDGWCPPGRKCENGTIPDKFPLKETIHDRSQKALNIPRSQRTEFNVRDADASLILKPDHLKDSGTECTEQFARKYNKPILQTDPFAFNAKEVISEWLNSESVTILNIAGPSENTVPGIYNQVYNLLIRVFGSK